MTSKINRQRTIEYLQEYNRKVNLVLSDPRFFGDRKQAELIIQELEK